MKPRLLERGLAARDAGDVVGSANDLNRALAYDPTDPKLVRAVGTMRARERRLRTLRRAVPIVFAAVLVVSGTFGVVRWSRLATATGPSPSASGSASPPPSAPPTNAKTPATTAIATVTALATATSTSEPDATPPIASAMTTATGATTTAAPPVTAPVAATRKVRFQFNVGAWYRVDGGQEFESLKSEVELSAGEHVVTAWGSTPCCEVKTQKFKVEPGEGVQVVAVTLDFKPFTLTVIGVDSAKITVKHAHTGAVIWTGSGTMAKIRLGNETNVPATISVEATGFPPQSRDYTLTPGDTLPVRFGG